MKYVLFADDGLLQVLDEVSNYQEVDRRAECLNMKARNFGEKVDFYFIDERKMSQPVWTR